MRTSVRRRLFVLDMRGRIVQAQRGSPLEDCVFGVEPGGRHLPREVERVVKEMLARWRRGSSLEARTLTCAGYSVRIFPLAGQRANRVGVILELGRD